MTATDVYSLGAILYKPLTGRSPHESETSTSQVMEIISEKRDITLPSAVDPEVSRDLDYILRKTLRPEPEERYASRHWQAMFVHFSSLADRGPVR